VQIVTSDAGGNLATASAASLGLVNSSQITAINGEFANLSSQIGEVRRGIAATAAIAYAATPSAPGRRHSRSTAAYTTPRPDLVFPSSTAWPEHPCRSISPVPTETATAARRSGA